MKLRDLMDAENQKSIHELSKTLAEISQEINKQFEPINKALKEVLSNPEIQSAITDIAINLSKFEKSHNKFIEKLKKGDVPAIPFFTRDLPIFEVFNLMNKPNKTAIEIYEEFFSKEKVLTSLHESWMECDEYKKRSEILRDCLFAHFQKKYTLSIPCMLAQIDGLITEFYKTEKIEKALRKIDRSFEGSISGRDVFIAALERQLFKPTPSNKAWGKNYPNRHLILHGKDIKYFREKHYSLRLILILDFFTLYIRKS